jgi:NTP pyrophosphatase (non-canonical NTP hydrolase)
MKVRALQQEIDAWVRANGGYWSELSLLARLSEEVGEVARAYNQRFGGKPKKPGEADTELEDELADVIWIVLCMANQQGIDLEVALSRVLAKVRSRGAPPSTAPETREG